MDSSVSYFHDTVCYGNCHNVRIVVCLTLGSRNIKMVNKVYVKKTACVDN
ncbi:MAG: hypothetical protein ACR5LA_07550 [Wolbachia sp.]